MGDDDCEHRTPAHALADESARLGLAKREGRLALADVDRAAGTAARAAELFIAERAHHEPAFGALVNVAGILAGAGRTPELAPHALAAMAHESDWPGRDAAWKDLIYNGLFGAMDRSPPEHIFPVLELGREAARRFGRHALWQALAEAARDAGKALGAVGRWDLHEKLDGLLEEAPAELAGLRAATMTDGIVHALTRREGARALALHDRIRELANRHATARVAQQRAVALECLLDANAPDPYLEPPKIAALVDEQLALTRAWPDEHEVARALTSSSATVLTLLEVMRDEPRHRALTDMQTWLAERWPGDDEVHFNSARALVNAAIVRVNESKRAGLVARIATLFAGDATLERLELTMEALLRACPMSPALAEARGRFERATGRAVRSPASSAPPPPPLHPELAPMRATFEKMQVDGITSEHLAAMHAIVGPGGYLPRATREGPGAYAADERYYTDFLDEVARQFQADRTGYWKAREVQIEAITRYLIDDATERIAARAASLRAQLKMPPRKRS